MPTIKLFQRIGARARSFAQAIEGAYVAIVIPMLGPSNDLNVFPCTGMHNNVYLS